VKVLKGQFLKEKQIKHVSFQEEVEEIEAEGFDITDTPYNNNSNNNNSNNSNNNDNSNTRIITRSQTHRINSSQDIALSPPQVVVEIPRKSDEYYNQYQRILINLITNNVNIFYIKDTQKEPSTYKQAINGPEKKSGIILYVKN